ENRPDAPPLFVERYRFSAWPCAFATDVEEVSALGQEFFGPLDRLRGIEVLAAVRKGIGRNVNYAHDVNLRGDPAQDLRAHVPCGNALRGAESSSSSLEELPGLPPARVSSRMPGPLFLCAS